MKKHHIIIAVVTLAAVGFIGFVPIVDSKMGTKKVSIVEHLMGK